MAPKRRVKKGGANKHTKRLKSLAGLPEAEKRRRLLALLADMSDVDSDDATWVPPDFGADGRTVDAPQLRFETLTGQLALDEQCQATLVRACKMVFALDGSSWLPCQAKPRCLPEKLAAAIFAHHTRGADFDPLRSGAEWWAQVRQSEHKEEGIQFHWDTDEVAVERHDLNVHPHLSTVTYLSACGAPTLVLDVRNTRTPGEQGKLCGPISSGCLSLPHVGKHIVFDGQLLHGTAPVWGVVAGERVTFLVNIWLNHRPSNCREVPDGLAGRLGDGEIEVNLQMTRPPAASCRADDENILEATFGRRTHSHGIRLRAPVLSEKDGHSCVVEWSEGGAELSQLP